MREFNDLVHELDGCTAPGKLLTPRVHSCLAFSRRLRSHTVERFARQCSVSERVEESSEGYEVRRLARCTPRRPRSIPDVPGWFA